ncbi:MAG TPA: tetratricopeptide repeat protein [Candidatus Koribacter sp.]|jgi:tetratricopeptide (TPR) repeat protein
MHRRKVLIVCLVVLAAAFGGSIWTSTELSAMHDQLALQEVLYLPSVKTVKAMSLGYTGLMADVYWTRVVQYYGRKHLEKSVAYKLLPPLLDITTTLDPHLDIAYEFGAFFLSQKPPQGAGAPDEAIALVKKGIAQNPDHWRLYYDLGFVYWMEKKDFRDAAEAFASGAKLPGSKPWMTTMAGAMAQGADDLGMARTLWNDVLKETKDPLIRNNAAQRLQCIDSDEAVMALQKRVDAFKEHFGRNPGNMRELVDVGLLRGIPLDPVGNPYGINAYGEVVVKDQSKLPFITKGLPHGEEATVLYNKFVSAAEEKKQKEEEEKKKHEEQKSSGPGTRPTDQK